MRKKCQKKEQNMFYMNIEKQLVSACAEKQIMFLRSLCCLQERGSASCVAVETTSTCQTGKDEAADTTDMESSCVFIPI